MLKGFVLFSSILAVLCFRQKSQLESESSESNSALFQVVQKLFYPTHVKNLDVIFYGENHVNNETVLTFLKSFDGTSRINQISITSKITIVSPTIIFADSIEHLKKFFKISSYDIIKRKIYDLLLFVKDFKNDFVWSDIDVNKNPQSSMGDPIHFAYFLIENKINISLGTFEWYTPKWCGVKQFVTLNTFVKSKFQWIKPLDIAQKFMNFHNCTITHHTSFFSMHTLKLIASFGAFATMIHPKALETLEIQESNEIKIRNIFAKRGNFTSKSLGLGGEELRFTATIGQYYNYMNSTDCSKAFYYNPTVVMYSVPSPYSNFEKMLMPFDSTTWIALTLTFLLAFVAILIINRLSDPVKNLFYGKNNRTTTFNVVRLLFGISQTKQPEEHFGRIIVTSFVLFCLVMRTAYQGVFFDKFTSGINRSPPKTFADLNDQGYTLYIQQDFYDDLNRTLSRTSASFNMPKIKRMNFYGLFELYKKMGDPSTKAGIFTMQDDLKLYQSVYNDIPQTIDELINNSPQGFCTPEPCFFSKLSHKVMDSLIYFGIAQYHLKWWLDVVLRPLPVPEKTNKVFSYEDLKFGFIIWFIACSISFTVFVVEVIFFKTRKWFKDFLGLYFLLRAIRHRMF